MKPINGVYLGWIPPHSDSWEPLYRTIRCGRGYQSERTRLYTPTIERYPGLTMGLNFRPDPADLPFALERRTPKVRPDYERDAHLLNLPYPIVDLFEYIGRTGGLFSGDNFSICPIVEPNDDGTYSYESVLWKIETEVRDSLNETSELNVVIRAEEQPIVTAGNRILGELMPNFSMLGDAVFNVKLVKIGERHYFGGGDILISFDTSIDLYSTPNFELMTPEVASV